MQAIAHGWKPKSKKGPSKEQAKEYIHSQSSKSLPESAHKSEQEILEKLLKAYERRDDYTLVDPREFYGAVQSMNKRLMNWLIRIVENMNQGESKTVPMPMEEAKLHIRKLAGDMYSGWLIDKIGNIDHLFDRITLPVLSTQIMSVYEVYDSKQNEKDEIDKLNDLHSKIQDLHDKIRGFKDNGEGSIKPQQETIEVQKLSDPEKCSDCGCSDCNCYSYLSKPTVYIEPNGKIKITFDKDWSHMDKSNFLKSMKYIINKKKKGLNKK